MGLNKDTGGGAGGTIFINPINIGDDVYWARRTTKDDPEGTLRKSEKIGDVYEIYYPSITGYIESVRIVQGKFGEDLEIRMKDDDPDSGLEFLLQMGFDSDLGKHFIIRMEEMDANKVTEVGIFRKQEGGKDRRYTWVKQDGEKIANLYTKNGPNDLPQPEKKELRGGKVDYDFTEQNDFLFELAQKHSINLGWAKDDVEFMTSTVKRKSDGDDKPAEPSPAQVDGENPPVDDDDDIPF